MKFVATKTAHQLDLQALHRVRERLVRQRTSIINQIRAESDDIVPFSCRGLREDETRWRTGLPSACEPW
jgi:transposase